MKAIEINFGISLYIGYKKLPSSQTEQFVVCQFYTQAHWSARYSW